MQSTPVYFTIKYTFIVHKSAFSNQELPVLYGRPTIIYGGQLFLYIPHILLVNMTRDLAHLQMSDLQGGITPIC